MNDVLDLEDPTRSDAALDAKWAQLQAVLRDLGQVVVAYSGGVDSALLLRAAVDTLGDRAVGLTAVSASYPESELQEARALAADMGARLIEVNTHEIQREGYRANAGDRCYFCKTELFEVAGRAAAELNLGAVCYGAIPEDLGDHRPGMRAAEEHTVHAPLIDAGLSKSDIRALSRRFGMPTWDKPASACLSSRFPYGTPITVERLQQVERCEAALRELGLRQFRARYHGDLVRVEVAPEELPKVFADAELRSAMITACKKSGFRFVSVDLEGYRTGSTNEALVQVISPARRVEP